jgi:hypothetical protein
VAIVKIKPAKSLKRKCDVLFSKIVRSLGYCEKCGERNYAKLSTSHIMSRRFSVTRCMRSNAQCLCHGCHLYFTNHPVEFTRWLFETIGEAEYDRLYQLAHTPSKVNWKTVYEELLVETKKLNLY